MKVESLLLGALSKVRFGEIELTTPEGAKHHFKGSEPGERATLRLKDWSVIRRVLAESDIGLGETYMEELWDSDDLPAFLTFCERNRAALDGIRGLGLLARIRAWFGDFGSKNTIAGSQHNIANTYDYPPELFRSFTDKMMTYSSGFWGGQDMSFDDAQVNKYNRILEKIGGPPKHILEMGCGWGYFLDLAAKRGYTVTGCTISKQQYEWAKKLNAEAIADGRVNLFLDDYRNMPGQYDAVMSTGFFEHVGSEFWVEHFRKVKQYLKPGGVAMIQTMLTNHYDGSQGSRVNFNTKHIFPGGEFPSIGTFIVAAEKAGLKCEEHLAFGQDYARTMSHCWENFHNNLSDVRALGFDDVFIRKWKFFIAGWYAMFRSGNFNVMQAKLMHYP